MYFSTLFSGSSGNALYIEAKQVKILVDAGLSGVRVQKALESMGRRAADLDAIMVTNEHRDHTWGVGVLSRRFDLPVYATEYTWEAMEPCVGKIAEKNCVCIAVGRSFQIGDLGIDVFGTCHDAADPCSFAFTRGDKRLGLLTDTGCLTNSMEKFLRGCNTLILESNHDSKMLTTGPYPWILKNRIRSHQGHLSNDDAAQAIGRFVTKDTTRVVLAHLSQENNVPDLAMQNAANTHREMGYSNVFLAVASRSQAMPLTAVG